MNNRPHLTQMAEKALQYALDVAGEMGHSYIGSEHLLLGVLSITDSVASRVLSDKGLDLETANEAVKETMGVGTPTRLSGNEFTKRTTEINSSAAYEAAKRNSGSVGTEHLLFAILLMRDCVAAKLIAGAGIDATEVAKALITVMNGGSSGDGGNGVKGNAGGENGERRGNSQQFAIKSP